MMLRSDKVKELCNNTLWLAPLAGYTDQAFRRICKEWGADVLVSEMVSADGIIQNQRETWKFVRFTEKERPFGIQLFGSDPEVMAKAAQQVCALQPDFIDINMGCPVKKVINRMAGAALMKDIPLAAEIVKQVRSVMPEDMPLSVKFRSGWNSESLNYLDFGLALQAAGADMLILHPRTAKMMFTGKSDWSHIAALKQQAGVPVIGNGDVLSREDALTMRESTGCDGIMIGRGALGNPWLFSQIKAAHEPELNNKLKLDTLLTQIDYALQDKPEHLVAREMKSQCCFYTKGLKHSAAIRDKINHSNNLQELKAILDRAFND